MATQRDDRISSTDDTRTVVEIDGRYYILATSSTADQDDQVLKHGESFAIFDRWGDIQPVGKGEEGLYHRGTRHLSGLRLRLGDERPLLLGSTTRHDNSRLTIDLANPDMDLDGRLLRAGTIHLSRTKVLWAGACHERIEVRNFGQEAVVLPISMRFAADFADIFEVRGMERPARGTVLEPSVEDGRIVLAYDGLDGVRRTTTVAFSPEPDRIEPGAAGYALELPPGRSTTIELRIDSEAASPARPVDFDSALERFTAELDGRFDRSARISSSSELFDDWVTPQPRRHRDDDERDGRWAVPVCRRPVVQHGLRPRRDHHRVPDAVGPALARPRRAEASRRPPGHRRRPFAAMPSRARSCTSFGTARWRRSWRSRSAATTAVTTPRRCS